MVPWFAVLVVLGAWLGALAQVAVVVPVVKPEARMRIYADPAAIASKLLSGSEEVRRRDSGSWGLCCNSPMVAFPNWKRFGCLR